MQYVYTLQINEVTKVTNISCVECNCYENVKKNFATIELSLPNMPFNQCHLPVISTHSNKCYFWFLLFQTSDHFSGDIPGQARSKQNFGDSCSYIYTGQMPFLSLDQQHQNTEGKLKTLSKYFSHS